jgi:hypothetical protein
MMNGDSLLPAGANGHCMKQLESNKQHFTA